MKAGRSSAEKAKSAVNILPLQIHLLYVVLPLITVGATAIARHMKFNVDKEG